MILARRFLLDRSAVVATRRLRLASAVVILAANGWLLASEPSGLAIAVGAISVLVALGWIAASVRTAAYLRDHRADHLSLDTDGLRLADGSVRHHIGWTNVTDVEIDEEKLVVCVSRRDAPPLRLQPRYQSVSLDELGQAVREAWLDAAPREKC
ncbi:MAG: hypothetical protein DRJ42_29410 [Deltaproteobacteria bacterium]|nr:MAG: hypothetical protein DRJ42_29410 [Deltaproteobacteria bacterium]